MLEDFHTGLGQRHIKSIHIIPRTLLPDLLNVRMSYLKQLEERSQVLESPGAGRAHVPSGTDGDRVSIASDAQEKTPEQLKTVCV